MKTILKKQMIIGTITIPLIVFGQIGINNIDPQTTLDITAKSTDGSRAEGLLVPRLTGDQIKSADSKYGSSQKGTIIFATSAVTISSSKTANIVAEGYYFFDGTMWQKITGVDITNDSWVNDPSNSEVKLDTKSDGTSRTTGTEFIVKDNGVVGIGTAAPDNSAAVDIRSSNKGILIPRITLTSATDQTTISNPALGLLAYNTGAGALAFKGYVFWTGTEWKTIDNNTTVNPAVASLNCIDSSTFPSVFTSGTPYSGTLTVPYSSGNGGSYSSSTSITQNGLTFTLNQGSLNYGNGSITYSISGTPNFTSPNTISVPLSFLGNSCNVTVGANVSVNPIQYLKKVISPIPTTSDAAVQNATKATFGNLSVRYGGLPSNVASTTNSIQLSPSLTTQITIWSMLTGGGAPNTLQSTYAATTVNANNWIGWGTTFNPYYRDYGIIYVTLHATGEIYRITMLCNNSMTSPTVNSNITFFIEKL